MTRAASPVRDVVDLAHEIVASRPTVAQVDDLAGGLDALPAMDAVGLDAALRHWHAGLHAERLSALRSRWRRGERHRAWTLLALASDDGFEREVAIGQVELRPGTVALLILRATDWVEQVRAAALRRLEEVPAGLLIDALGLADHLAEKRARGDGLAVLLDRRLDVHALRAGTRRDDVRVRRAAWRRLFARGSYEVDDVLRAAQDRDVLVRASAAGTLADLGEGDRRRVASMLVRDGVGWLAGRGLAVLVELDGTPAIHAALTSAGPALRRQAIGWAAARGVDARAVFLAELERDRTDRAALVALAEIGDARDEALLLAALGEVGVPPRVRTALLKPLARLNPGAAKPAAMLELEGGGGKAGRAALLVLQAAPLDAADRRELAQLALDPDRPDGARVRAIAALRRDRWLQLATILEGRAAAVDDRFRARLDGEVDGWLKRNFQTATAPGDDHRAAIASHLDGLDPEHRRAIGWILRTNPKC